MSINELQYAVESGRATPEQIRHVIDLLDQGTLRVAEPHDDAWQVNTWVKTTVLAYFGIQEVEPLEVGPFVFRDKIPLKRQFGRVRIVPGPGAVRYGAFLGDGVIMMPPAYVNIGAYVGANTMIDSNVLVGSCAQIGSRVHLSAGVQIGGVLEPIQAQPVIIEDDAFIGAGSIVVEGVQVGSGAVLAPGTILSAATPIVELNAVHEEVAIHRGVVPPRAIVVPGVRSKGSQGFGYQTPLLIKYRDVGTDAKLALNETLRSFG